jgi:hypothetical protein
MDGGMGEVMVKRVLMIAFHFPPLHGSSGIQRTLKFAKYLPQHDWEPLVLTAHSPATHRGILQCSAAIPAGSRSRTAG